MAQRPAGRLSGDALLERLADVARHLSEATTLDETLQRIVDDVAQFIDHCDGASLMLIGGRDRISSPASSSDVAYESNMAQYETGEGPCLGAIAEHHTIVVDDLEHDDRWPQYRERALDLGIRSMISFQLFVAGDTMGALNLYSSRPHAFDDRSRLVGEVFASHAAVAMKAAISEAGLEAALESRDLIAQAKGILMEREHITASEAFERLKAMSQHHNRRVRDLAAEIAATGEIPDDE